MTTSPHLLPQYLVKFEDLMTFVNILANMYSWPSKFHTVVWQQIWGEMVDFTAASFELWLQKLLTLVHICQSYHKQCCLLHRQIT